MRGHKERGGTDLAKACAVVVALLCVPFAVAAFDTGVLPGPAGGQFLGAGFGLVERLADPADGRVSILVPTEHGYGLADRIKRHRRSKLAQITADWSPGDVVVFAGLLERFIDGMEQLRAEPAALPPNGTKETT